MAARIVNCAKLKEELPGIDEDSEEGERALRMSKLLGGPEMAKRVHESISAKAWEMWNDHMLMVVNEFRLDPTSEESTPTLKKFMNEFLFGEGQNADIDNYVPPEQTPPAK